MATPTRPRCFGAGARSAHLEGRWARLRDDTPPYVLNRSSWPPFTHDTHWFGACAEAQPGRQARYEWRPQCALEPLDRAVAAACSRAPGALRGRRVLMVGDSTMLQQFISLVSLLGGRFGSWSVAQEDGPRMKPPMASTARADPRRIRAVVGCGADGELHLEFARNDLLLYSHAGAEAQRAVRLDLSYPRIMADFTAAAARADIVVLGAGAHFHPAHAAGWKGFGAGPSDYVSLLGPLGGGGAREARLPRAGAARPPRGSAPASAELDEAEQWAAFYMRSLNHTIRSVLASRRGRPSRSVVLMSPTKPVSGCRGHRAPISLLESLDLDLLAESEWARSWRGLRQLQLIGGWIATFHAVSYLDVFPLSAMRPDAAMGARELPAERAARAARPGRPLNPDCVHYCLPGPPDTWNRLLLGLLLADGRALRAPRHAAEDGPPPEVAPLRSLWWWPRG